MTGKTANLSARDPEVEELLTKRGVTWEYVENVSPSQFDPAASLNNQSRLGVLHEPTVVRYTEALRNDHALPAIVARHDSNGLYVVVSGNHRLEAYTRAHKLVNVYVVQASMRTILELTFVLNIGHGLPPAPEELLRQALHLVESGMSQTAASALLQVQPAALARAVQLQEAQRRASAAGLAAREWDALPTSTRQRLFGVNTDEGFIELARLTVDAGLSTEEVVDVLSTVNTTRSGDAQRSLVRDLREQVYKPRIEAGGSTYKPSRGKKHTLRTNLERVVTQILHLQDIPALMNHYPASDREEIAKRVEDALGTLREVLAALNSPGPDNAAE